MLSSNETANAELERLTGERARISLDDIVGHPHLSKARNLYLRRFLEIYGSDPFLARLLIEAGRFFVYTFLVVLEAGYDRNLRETWPTVGLLKQKLSMLGLVSERQVDHLIARLCAVGFLEMRPADQDRRIRLLIPTEKLKAHDRDWLAAHYLPLTILYPQHDYSRVMERDPEFQNAYRRACLRFMPFGAKLFASIPDMLLFLEKSGGYMIIAALLQSASENADQKYAAIPYADVGDRFGISRTQVRNLLVTAESSGLVKLHVRGGHRVEILPRLWSSHDRSIAMGMYLHDVLYLATLKASRSA